jgi:hypothetical protein
LSVFGPCKKSAAGARAQAQDSFAVGASILDHDQIDTRRGYVFYARKVTPSLVLDIDIPFGPNSFARINVLDFVCIMFPQRYPQVHVIVRPGTRFTDNLEGQLG